MHSVQVVDGKLEIIKGTNLQCVFIQGNESLYWQWAWLAIQSVCTSPTLRLWVIS